MTRENKDNERKPLIRLIISLLFSAPIVYLALGHELKWPIPHNLQCIYHPFTFALTQLLAILPVTLVNRSCFSRGLIALLSGRPNKDSIMALGAAAALAYGFLTMARIGFTEAGFIHIPVNSLPLDLDFEFAAMSLSFIALSAFLEALTTRKISDEVSKLVKLRPNVATVLKDGTEKDIETSKVEEGDIVVVRPGQSIPVDGMIIEGTTIIDSSALTGMNPPSTRRAGDHVWSASVNLSGLIRIRAETNGNMVPIENIIKLADESNASNKRVIDQADELSRVLFPTVIALACIMGLFNLAFGVGTQHAISAAVAMLILSCTGSIGLAAPATILAAILGGKRTGVLVKSTDQLKNTYKIDTVLLNKSGSITLGKPSVTEIISLSELDDNELLTLAASIEAPTEHPLGFAIVAEARKSGLPLFPLEAFRPYPGKGVEATIRGKRYFAGGPALLSEHGIDISPAIPRIAPLAKMGKTPFGFGCDGKLLGIIVVADVIKLGSREAVASMNRMGLDVIMITNDNATTAEGIRKETGIQRVVVEMKPEGKANAVAFLKKEGKTVAVIGNGISDVPALAEADVGMTCGAGSGFSVEAAGLILESCQLDNAVTALRLGRAVHKNITVNLAIALAGGVFGIPLAMGLILPENTLLLGQVIAGTMIVSTLAIGINALRIRFFK